MSDTNREMGLRAERDARDVLADRIEEWAGDDWHVYDYADRLIKDLDSAGYEIRPTAVDPADLIDKPSGATLLWALYVPEADESEDPEDIADSLIANLNDVRKRLGNRRLIVSLHPAPQWFSKRTLDVLRKANELIGDPDA